LKERKKGGESATFMLSRSYKGEINGVPRPLLYERGGKKKSLYWEGRKRRLRFESGAPFPSLFVAKSPYIKLFIDFVE